MTNNVGLNYKALFLFSLPSIFSSILEPLAGVVDTALVGKIDTNWLGAMSIGIIIISSLTWIFNFLVHASTQSVSEAFGERNYPKLVGKAQVSLLMALGLGAVATIIIYLIRFYAYKFAGATDELLPLIDEYFKIRIFGLTITLLFTTALSILRGLGQVKESFYLVGVTTLSNIFISWLFLYELDFGVSGAAWGTVLANFVGLLFTLILILKNPIIKENFSLAERSKENWLHFGKNSLDLFGRSFALTGCFFLCTKFAAGLGVKNLAAHQVLLQAWLFSSFVIDGVAITGNIIGANLMAKNDIEGLKKLAASLLGMGAMIGALFSFAYTFFGTSILGLFTNDVEVLALMAPVWVLVSSTQVLAAIAYIYDGILFGLGAFSFIRKHMIISVTLIFLPIAFLVFIYQKLFFLWLALCALLIYRAASGHFKTRQVIGAHYGRFNR